MTSDDDQAVFNAMTALNSVIHNAEMFSDEEAVIAAEAISTLTAYVDARTPPEE